MLRKLIQHTTFEKSDKFNVPGTCLHTSCNRQFKSIYTRKVPGTFLLAPRLGASCGNRSKNAPDANFDLSINRPTISSGNLSTVSQSGLGTQQPSTCNF